MSWLSRSELGSARGTAALPKSGLVLSAVPGEAGATLAHDELEVVRRRSAETLAAAGVRSGDRVAISLNSDGDLGGAGLALALAELGAAAVVAGPRGRMRLLATLRTHAPNVWITTPTGALDFLARLYLEFNVDPIELELERILLVGEIGSPGTERRLASEFEARVSGLYCDPVFGVALACAVDGAWTVPESDGLLRAALDRDEILEGKLADAPPAADARPAELVLRPSWSAAWAEHTIRTGQVLGESDADGLFRFTVGDHLLVRGRWLSLPLLRRALATIDGIAGWTLDVTRGDGTLDKLTLTLAFERESLVDNPMWLGRAREAVAATTPITFEVASVLATEQTVSEQIVDERGHHLGTDRSRVADAAPREGAEPGA